MKLKDEKYKRKCRSCKYFVEYANTIYAGECHRNAPIAVWPRERLNDIDDGGMPFKFPEVLSCDWCGQYEKFKT